MCVVFIGPTMASCVGLGPLNSVKLGHQRTGLQNLLAADATQQSNWIEDRRRTSSYVTNWQIIPPESAVVIFTWQLQNFEELNDQKTLTQICHAGFWISERFWWREAIIFSSSYSQILCMSRRGSVLQSFSTKSNYFLLHYVERYKTWQKHHIKSLM